MEDFFENEIDSFSYFLFFLNSHCCFVVRRMPFKSLICPEANIPSKWTPLSFKIRYSIKGFSIPCRWCIIYVLRIRAVFIVVVVVVAKSERYTPVCQMQYCVGGSDWSLFMADLFISCCRLLMQNISPTFASWECVQYVCCYYCMFLLSVCV